MKASSLVLINVLSLFAGVRGGLITNLPGLQEALSFKMYSGYIPVDEATGRQLFYWFAESQSEPSKDPLVVWFSGGPGCSGIDALMTENGPVTPSRDGAGLVTNPYSWNRVANMLWLEQPAGVGFSYTPGATQYNSSDTQSAADNYAFLKTWVNKEFPQFKGRDLWITGESYAGMYVPQLTKKILTGDDVGLKQSIKGFMLGNPVMGCQSASDWTSASVPYQFNRFFYDGLLSFGTYANWTSHGCDRFAQLPTPARDVCISIADSARASIGVINQPLKRAMLGDSMLQKDPILSDLDPDNLYQDFCIGNGTLDTTLDGSPASCKPSGDWDGIYLNTEAVQEAIHAKVGIKWSTCNEGSLNYDGDLQSQGLIPVLKEIFDLKALHILYYSGDVDVATVPMQLTQACLHELSDVAKQVQEWKPWTINQWHAGYWEVFDKYTFASVKGAGHEVPQYQPHIAYEMFSRFLAKHSLTDDDARQCSAHDACRQLAGDCCPTKDGVMLDCCNQRDVTVQPLTQGAVLNAEKHKAALSTLRSAAFTPHGHDGVVV